MGVKVFENIKQQLHFIEVNHQVSIINYYNLVNYNDYFSNN